MNKKLQECRGIIEKSKDSYALKIFERYEEFSKKYPDKVYFLLSCFVILLLSLFVFKKPSQFIVMCIVFFIGYFSLWYGCKFYILRRVYQVSEKDLDLLNGILKKYGNKRSVYINCNEESGRYYVDDDNGKLKDITSMVMWHNPNTCLYSTLEYLDLCTFGIDRQKTSFIESRDCV